jgi:predicted O-linked N-acetylglucosamine transferase (SPINDLY family)
MRILKTVPKSVLWLQGGNSAVEKNLKNEAMMRSINKNRIIFAEKLPKEEHLARLRLADIALDTRIVGGSATTCDALWAGVPVLTMLGKHFNSRMSSSILKTIGLDNLIMKNIEEYETGAIKLAKSPEELKEIKKWLVSSRCTSPLFDTQLFTNAIERAYKKAWKRYTNGLPPDHIDM